MDVENRKRDGQPKIEGSNVAKKKCVFVPNWLVEVLAWIARIELANSSLSTASSIFKQLCWPKLHGNVKGHKTQRLIFLYAQDEESFNPRVELRQTETGCCDFPDKEYSIIPIASRKPPEYINRIGSMFLFFLDGQILKFVENILPLLNNIHLSFRNEVQCWASDNIRIRPLRHLLQMLAPKTYQLYLCDFSIDFYCFNRFFPGFIDSVQFIFLNSRKTDWDLLMEWLNAGRMDGKHKMLEASLRNEHKFDFFEQLKKEFLRSKRPSTFIIVLGRGNYLPDLTLENAETGELLTAYQNQMQNRNFNLQYIVRHAKGMEHLRTDWEREFVEDQVENVIAIQIEEIGFF